MTQRYEFFVSLHYPAGAKTIRVTDTHCNNKKRQVLSGQAEPRTRRERGSNISQWSMMALALSKPVSQTFLFLSPS